MNIYPKPTGPAIRIPAEGESEIIGRYMGHDIHWVNNGAAMPSLELRKRASIWSKLVAAVRGWPAWMHFTNPALDLKGPKDPFDGTGTYRVVNPAWQEHPFHVMTPEEFYGEPTDAQRKNEKLAALARYIEDARGLIVLKKNRKQKHSHILAAIVQAQNERLQIESGLRTWDGTTWALRGDA